MPTSDPSGEEALRFDLMIDGALRGVVRQALGHVIAHGLPGTHHFYLTFHTAHDGVDIPDALRAAHPEEMTIVLQNQFWDLNMDDDAFEVTLSFNRLHHRLHVPFAALTSFADPSVQFGLQFQTETAQPAEKTARPAGAGTDSAAGAENETTDETETAETAETGEPVPEGGDEKIVTLDRFRKK